MNRAAVAPEPILQAGLLMNANGFFLAHNHPSGDPSPSAEDMAFTKRLKDAGEIVGPRLIDHLILGDDDSWVSLKQRGF
jgi:DNA repair protein RadC